MPFRNHYRWLWLYFTLLGTPFLFLAWTLPAQAASQANFPILGVLHSGHQPEALSVDKQTHWVYIAHEGPGLVAALNPTTGKIAWTNSLDDVASDLLVDDQQNLLYVQSFSTHTRQSRLNLLDGKTGRLITSFKSGAGENALALDQVHHKLYLTDGRAGQVDVFKLSSSQAPELQLLQTIAAGPHPQAVAVDSRRNRLYVADTEASKVTLFSLDNAQPLANIAVAREPLPPIKLDEASGRLYVPGNSGQELDVIENDKIVGQVSVSPNPEGLDFSPVTDRIYIATEGSTGHPGTSITVIDQRSLTVLGTIKVGRSPDGLAIDPTLRRIYVAAEDSDAVVEMSDSEDNLPLSSALPQRSVPISLVLELLRQVNILTIVVMILTLVIATLGALLPRGRGRETPQTRPEGESSH